jgi:putative Mn2+ efflux pump MntP
MVIAIGAQAFIVTQVGVRLGSRIGDRWRETAEKIGGVALTTLGLTLVAEQLVA